jgi:neutral ceramidase
MQYEIGSSRTDITIFKRDVGMLGYGIWYNVVRGIETPIFARAVVIKTSARKVVFVNAEICFSTVYLKNGVVQVLQEQYPELGFNDDNIMITAQHTHSAPGGFTQHFLYNLIQPGFQQEVYECYRDGIVNAIVNADQQAKPAVVKQAVGSFDLEQDVAFNRSLRAYNRNKEITQPERDARKALDRTMKLYRFEDAMTGQPLFWGAYYQHLQ